MARATESQAQSGPRYIDNFVAAPITLAEAALQTRRPVPVSSISVIGLDADSGESQADPAAFIDLGAAMPDPNADMPIASLTDEESLLTLARNGASADGVRRRPHDPTKPEAFDDTLSKEETNLLDRLRQLLNLRPTSEDPSFGRSTYHRDAAFSPVFDVAAAETDEGFSVMDNLLNSAFGAQLGTLFMSVLQPRAEADGYVSVSLAGFDRIILMYSRDAGEIMAVRADDRQPMATDRADSAQPFDRQADDPAAAGAARPEPKKPTLVVLLALLAGLAVSLVTEPALLALTALALMLCALLSLRARATA